jgi:hypothetical protein
MAGLGLVNSGPLEQVSAWMRAKNMSPLWALMGGVMGGLVGGAVLGPMAKGAVGAAAASWAWNKLTTRPQDSLVGLGAAALVGVLLTR